MDAQERQAAIELALNILRTTLIETETSMAIGGNKLIFFGTDDYLKTQDINKCPRFAVNIEDLVR